MAFVCFLIVSRFMTGCKGTVRRKDHDIHCVILGGIACYESFVTRKTLITTLFDENKRHFCQRFEISPHVYEDEMLRLKKAASLPSRDDNQIRSEPTVCCSMQQIILTTIDRHPVSRKST